MIVSEKELHAQKAINQFVQFSCVFILPGPEGQIASDVGSGILINTKRKHLAVLTAKHVAMDSRKEEYRLGFFKCLDPVPNFVAGILLFPGDVDVALLVVKDELIYPLKKLAIRPEAIPTINFEIQEQDILILKGFPAEMSHYSKERSEQGFAAITHWFFEPSVPLDANGMYRLKWKDAVDWRSDKDFKLPSPKGMSGGPLWRFRKPSENSIWAPEEIGKVIGIQSAWDRKETMLIETIHKWSSWFHESLKKIDESFG
jgi:hypothetical protein